MEPFSPFIFVGIIVFGFSLKHAIDTCKRTNNEESVLINNDQDDDEVPPKYEDIFD